MTKGKKRKILILLKMIHQFAKLYVYATIKFYHHNKIILNHPTTRTINWEERHLRPNLLRFFYYGWFFGMVTWLLLIPITVLFTPLIFFYKTRSINETLICNRDWYLLVVKRSFGASLSPRGKKELARMKLEAHDQT